MKDFVDTEDEPIFPTQIYTLMNDNIKYSTLEYRNALYQHINKKYREPIQFTSMKTASVVTKAPLSQKTPNASGKKSANISS